jgi:hypothetical protein
MFKVMLGLMVQVGVVEQTLGWDTSNVETGAAELASLFNAHRLVFPQRVSQMRQCNLAWQSTRCCYCPEGLEGKSHTLRPSCAALMAPT